MPNTLRITVAAGSPDALLDSNIPTAIAQYLSFSLVPGTGTMLQDLFELPAGHAVTFDCQGTCSLTNLFPFEQDEWNEDDGTKDPQHWIGETRRRTSEAVASRLPVGEPVGVFLFGTEHHEMLIEPKRFAPRLRQMVWHLDDPIGDPITQPNFELARRVSQDVRFVFNGEGGDPLFGGPKNLPMMMQHWYGIERDRSFREKAYLASYRRAYEEWTRVLHPSVREQIDPERDLESILVPFFKNSSLKFFLNKLMSINIRLKGAHLILPKVERMLAASALTPLAPLFDEELIRLSFQMPPQMKLRGASEKWVLKRAYENELPKEVIERPKSGMRVPVHFWFRGAMHRLAKRTLLSSKARQAELYDLDRVRQLLRYDIEEGVGRYGMRLWMLLTLELWRRVVVEEETLDIRKGGFGL